MISEALVADITKCHRFPPSKLVETLDKVQDELSRRGVSEDALFVLGRVDQGSVAEGRFPKAYWNQVQGDEDEAPQVAFQAIIQLLRASVAGRFGRVAILTFNRTVLTEVTSLPDLLVDTKPFAAVPKREVSLQETPVTNGEQRSETTRKSFVMEDLIKRRKLGPFSRYRPYIWSELERRFPGAKEQPFSEFFSECVEAGLKATGEEKTPSPGLVRDSLTKLLAKVQVLKSANGEFLSGGLSGSRSPMTELDKDFRRKADAELLLVILQEMSPIAFSDRREIAGALFHSQQPAAVKEVEQLLGYLVDVGKVEEFEKDDEFWFRLISGRQSLAEPGTVSSLAVLRSRSS